MPVYNRIGRDGFCLIFVVGAASKAVQTWCGQSCLAPAADDGVRYLVVGCTTTTRQDRPCTSSRRSQTTVIEARAGRAEEGRAHRALAPDRRRTARLRRAYGSDGRHRPYSSRPARARQTPAGQGLVAPRSSVTRGGLHALPDKPCKSVFRVTARWSSPVIIARQDRNLGASRTSRRSILMKLRTVRAWRRCSECCSLLVAFLAERPALAFAIPFSSSQRQTAVVRHVAN